MTVAEMRENAKKGGYELPIQPLDELAADVLAGITSGVYCISLGGLERSAQTLHETALLEMIAKLPEDVSRAAEAYKPVTIATYCFELADAFNNFYHNCPILKAPSEELIRARLALTAAAKQTLANALGLLGIEAPDMM